MDRAASRANSPGESTENTSEAEKMASVGGSGPGGVKLNMTTKDREEGTGQQAGGSAGDTSAQEVIPQHEDTGGPGPEVRNVAARPRLQHARHSPSLGGRRVSGPIMTGAGEVALPQSDGANDGTGSTKNDHTGPTKDDEALKSPRPRPPPKNKKKGFMEKIRRKVGEKCEKIRKRMRMRRARRAEVDLMTPEE